MTPPAESESRNGFSCSGRCSEPLESVREARKIDFGGLNNLLSFALGTTQLLLGKILGQSGSGHKIRSPAPGPLSDSDSSGFEHLLEQENPLRDSDSAGGVIVHTSSRHLHRVAAGSLRTIYRSDL